MIDSEAPISSMALPGLARALVAAGTLSQQSAEGLYAKAQAHKSSFIAELVGSGALSARELAHTMSRTFAAPLIDLDAIDVQRLPKGLLDPKMSKQFRIVVLSRRGNRITVATVMRLPRRLSTTMRNCLDILGSSKPLGRRCTSMASRSIKGAAKVRDMVCASSRALKAPLPTSSAMKLLLCAWALAYSPSALCWLRVPAATSARAKPGRAMLEMGASLSIMAVAGWRGRQGRRGWAVAKPLA